MNSIATTGTDTSSPNNTRIRACASYGKTFMLTIQNSLLPEMDAIYNYVSHLAGFQYGLICSHNKGHDIETLPHVHIVLQYNMGKRLSIKKLRGAHIDPMKYGSVHNMVKYAKGETGHDDIEGFEAQVLYEEGELKLNGGYRVTGSEVREFNSVEQVYELPLPLQKIAKSIYEEKQAEDVWNSVLDEVWNDSLTQPEVIYITGESGAGKTYRAIKEAKEAGYDKSEVGRLTIENNFFSFVNSGADCIIVPEFRPNQCRATLLLEFLDKYGFNAPIKGGFKFVRPKTIIIASIVPPEQLYLDEEKNKQFTRRITKTIRLDGTFPVS